MEELNDTEIFYLRVAWLVGISISSICLLIQISLLAIIPRCRKFDEKVLIHMSATRIVNTICEYYFLNDPPHSSITEEAIRDACLVTAYITDFALVAWMFTFTKNLYDRVVAVFILNKWNFLVITAVIWTVSLPFGVMFLVMAKYYIEHLFIYYRAYYYFKFLILLINALFFVRIFYVAKSKGKVTPNRNLKDVIRTSIVAFILVLANVLQVLSTDICGVFFGKHKIWTLYSGVLNSFHVIPLMVIFVLLVRAKIRGSIIRHVSSKLLRI